MTTRTIVTSQPDVECDVCERRLLRGEQPDIFIAAGRRRTVCERVPPAPPMRAGCARADSPPSSCRRPERAVGAASSIASNRPPGRPRRRGSATRAPRRTATATTSSKRSAPRRPPAAAPNRSPPQRRCPRVRTPAPEPPALPVDRGKGDRGVQRGEYPRRVSGVARSLGVPVINVRSAEHHDEVVRSSSPGSSAGTATRSTSATARLRRRSLPARARSSQNRTVTRRGQRQRRRLGRPVLAISCCPPCRAGARE